MVRWREREHKRVRNLNTVKTKKKSLALANLLGIKDAGLALLIPVTARINLSLLARIQREVDLEHLSSCVGEWEFETNTELVAKPGLTATRVTGSCAIRIISKNQKSIKLFFFCEGKQQQRYGLRISPFLASFKSVR